MDKLDFLFFTLIVLTLMFGFTFYGYKQSANIENMINDYWYDTYPIPEQCVNLSLLSTSYCLHSEVNRFYKFNKTDDSIRLTYEELNERGGDCLDWSRLYCSWGRQLGFDIDKPTLMDSSPERHAICMISNDEGYCILDQLGFKCFGVEA